VVDLGAVGTVVVVVDVDDVTPKASCGCPWDRWGRCCRCS